MLKTQNSATSKCIKLETQNSATSKCIKLFLKIWDTVSVSAMMVSTHFCLEFKAIFCLCTFSLLFSTFNSSRSASLLMLVQKACPVNSSPLWIYKTILGCVNKQTYHFLESFAGNGLIHSKGNGSWTSKSKSINFLSMFQQELKSTIASVCK